MEEIGEEGPDAEKTPGKDIGVSKGSTKRGPKPEMRVQTGHSLQMGNDQEEDDSDNEQELMSPGFPTQKHLSSQIEQEPDAERDKSVLNDELAQSASDASQGIGSGLGFASKVENECI